MNHQIIEASDNIIPTSKRSSKKAITELNYIEESDVSISKPVIIKDLTKIISPSKRKKIIKDKYLEINYETDPEDYKKIDEVVKKTVRSEDNNKSKLTEELKDSNQENDKEFYNKFSRKSTRNKEAE